MVEIESGVARCPYDPAHNSTALYVGKLFSFIVFLTDVNNSN